MAKTVKTQSEYYEIYKNEVLGENGDLTDFSDGSLHDIIGGAISIAMNENSELTISEFTKTFFDTAHGIAITGNVDDLQILAIDHFGERFKRPEAKKATGSVTFERPNTDAGDVNIAIDVVVKTIKDANGEEVSFKATEAVIMTGLTIDAEIKASVGGISGNVNIGKITVIETALTDSSITVSNAVKLAGGSNEQTDAEYRETIRSLIEALAGATEKAIKGAVLALGNISFASALTIIMPVKEWDIGGDAPIGDFFRIPFVEVYVADSDGNSSQSLINEAIEAVFPVRAAGVLINIKGGTSSLVDWDASITLNPAGPNFAVLSADPQMILDSMKNYINEDIDINNGFDKIDATEHIKAIWGSAGTNDLTSFTTNTPSGNIAGVTGTKLMAGTMSIT